jgi:hypothetical protein
MNAAFLLVCGLSLGQAVAGASTVSTTQPDLDGTYSVLVKTTTLAEASMVAAASQSVGAAPATPAPSPAQDIAGMAEIETVPEASIPPQVLTPVPPLDRSAPAAAGDNQVSQGPIALASNTPSTLPAETSERPNSAKRLLEDALSNRPHAALEGTPLALRDAVAGTIDRQLQLQIVSAYWQLTAAVARHRFALAEVEWLANIVVPDTSAAAVRLAAAQAIATAELEAAELDAVSKQYAMAEMVSNGVSSQPVLPTDLPIVGPYQTHFESLFASRPAPAGLHRIHRVLPLRLAAINARATAVDGADKLVSNAESAYVAGEVSLDELLRRFDVFRSQRLAFLAAVRDYNVDIAAYALAVADANAGHDKIVSMLVETPAPAPSGAAQPLAVPGVHATSAEPGQPTLATSPAEVSSPSAPPHGPPAEHATAEPASTTPPAEHVQVPSTDVPRAPADSGASAFRDVTPSEPTKPEILVPLKPARYRSSSLTPGIQAPPASSPNH